MVKTYKIKVTTQGNCHIVNITDDVTSALADAKLGDSFDGVMHLFHVGSTASLTTIEYEPGLVNNDMAAMFEKIAPTDGSYTHEATWDDDNGHSHIRAALMGPSLSVPVLDGQIALGTWQQVVLIDFDTRPRSRTIVCQILS